MIRKCKKCDWITENDTYSLCHACGGELQEWQLPKLKIRPTKRAPDRAKYVVKKSPSTAKRPAQAQVA